MLDIVKSKIHGGKIRKIKLLNKDKLEIVIDTNSTDFILLITVCHEIDDKELLFNHF